MIDLSYTLATIFVPLIIAWLLYHCFIGARKDKVLTPSLCFVFLYMLLHYPPLIILDDIPKSYVTLVNVALMGFLCGYCWLSKGFAYDTESLSRTIRYESDGKGLLISIVILLGGAFSIGFLYYQGPPPIIDAILYAPGNFKDKLLWLSSQREVLTKAHYFDGAYRGQGILKLSHLVLWQAAILGCLLYIKRQPTCLMWFVVSFVLMLAVLMLTGGGVRFDGLLLISFAVIGWTYLAGVTNRSLIWLAGLSLASVIIIGAIAPRYSTDENVAASLAHTIVQRLSLGNGANTYHIYRLIGEGDIAPRFGQEHVTQFLNALPGIQSNPPFAHELHNHLRPNSDSDRRFASHTYLGTLYLDFKWLGTVLIFILLGITIAVVENALRRQSPLARSCMGAYCSLYGGLIALSGPISFITAAVVFVPVVSLLIWMLVRDTSTSQEHKVLS